MKAGVDKDGGNIYVGRAIHEGEVQPAKVSLNHQCAYIAYDGAEISKSEFEVCRMLPYNLNDTMFMVYILPEGI